MTTDGVNFTLDDHNQGTFFQFLKKGRGDLPLLSPSSYAPESSFVYSFSLV